MSGEPATIDAVYTWVDGAFPGYPELLHQYSRNPHDLNPNRYRDNLDLLRYSLRSLQAYVPWIRSVVLVTTRPQVPSWLDTSAAGLRVVHHDELMDAGDLPTFSSFAIVANLHRLPGVSPRFLYVEDDYLFGAPTGLDVFVEADGRPRFHRDHRAAPPASERDAPGASPWQAAHSEANRLLDERYGPARRRMLRHMPLLMDVALWRETAAAWPETFRFTSASRFRTVGNVPTDYLYVQRAALESKAVLRTFREALRVSEYHGLDNWLPLQQLAFRYLAWRRPNVYCLNDNFGEAPNPKVVALVRRWLEQQYPVPSRFERP